MLDTSKFVDALEAADYTHLCVVPCSFAKSIINEVLNRSDQLEYFPCASEAVACSVAAGLAISGAKPIIIVQSSGLTNMGSAITSLLKPYNIKLPIIVSWRTYKEGDSEIQHSHLAKKLPDLVKAYGYNPILLDKDNISETLKKINNSSLEFQICLLESNTFTKIKLKEKFVPNLDSYPKRSEYLIYLNSQFKNTETKFIGTTGNTAREMYTFMGGTDNFYMAGNMGGALSLGLGSAIANKKVIVCGGDAEFVMHLGGLSTSGRLSQNKDISLIYILFDNESNKSTGGQNTFQNHLDYIGIAKACGINAHNKIINCTEEFKKIINLIHKGTGITFLHVKCSYDEETPRPPLNVVQNTSSLE
tara:strand:+ start:6981 stop:8063 length:1083 start_codon:yes stop_codon:yes gene_type:complete